MAVWHPLFCDFAQAWLTNKLDKTIITIHFRTDVRPIVGERVGMLYWITDPACSGFIIAYDLGGD